MTLSAASPFRKQLSPGIGAGRDQNRERECDESNVGTDGEDAQRHHALHDEARQREQNSQRAEHRDRVECEIHRVFRTWSSFEAKAMVADGRARGRAQPG
jgi:hypothetical protein